MSRKLQARIQVRLIEQCVAAAHGALVTKYGRLPRKLPDDPILTRIVNGLAQHFETGESLHKCLPELRGAPRVWKRFARDANLFHAFCSIPIPGDLKRANALLQIIKKVKTEVEADVLPFSTTQAEVYVRVAMKTGERMPTTAENILRALSKWMAE